MNDYRSGRQLANAALLLVASVLLLMLTTVAINAVLLVSPPATTAAATSAVALVQSIASAMSLAHLAAFIVSLCWIYRMVANLRPLGSPSLRYSPGAAVGSFFIPFVNLVVPCQMMAHVWTESQPRQLNEAGYALPARASLVTAWWIGNLLSGVVGVCWILSLISGDRGTAVAFALLHPMVEIVTGALFLAVVWRIQQRQNATWQDLELRRAAPRPTGDRLR